MAEAVETEHPDDFLWDEQKRQLQELDIDGWFVQYNLADVLELCEHINELDQSLRVIEKHRRKLQKWGRLEDKDIDIGVPRLVKRKTKNQIDEELEFMQGEFIHVFDLLSDLNTDLIESVKNYVKHSNDSLSKYNDDHSNHPVKRGDTIEEKIRAKQWAFRRAWIEQTLLGYQREFEQNPIDHLLHYTGQLENFEDQVVYFLKSMERFYSIVESHGATISIADREKLKNYLVGWVGNPDEANTRYFTQFKRDAERETGAEWSTEAFFEDLVHLHHNADGSTPYRGIYVYDKNAEDRDFYLSGSRDDEAYVEEMYEEYPMRLVVRIVRTQNEEKEAKSDHRGWFTNVGEWVSRLDD